MCISWYNFERRPIKPFLLNNLSHLKQESGDKESSLLKKTEALAVSTFRLLSGPFQHLSPFENIMTLYESSNLSQRLFTKRKMEKIK